MTLNVETPDGKFMLARNCNGCRLCCKVMIAEEPINKPANVWCVHCTDKGCAIHETRPPVCRNFHCMWLMDGTLGEEWQPERCHIVLALDSGGWRMNAHVDQDYPDAWRAEPHYSWLKKMAAYSLPRGGQVVAYVGRQVFVMLPDGHAELGHMGPDDYIYIEPLGEDRYSVRKVDEAGAEALRQAAAASRHQA